MELRSLGLRTDLIFVEFSGEVIDRGDHLVVRTPENPTFHWGNYLLYPRPPQPGELRAWLENFARNFADYTELEHTLFVIDVPTAPVETFAEFAAEGFELDEAVVLATRTLRRPPHPNVDAIVRPLAHESEWQATIDLQVATREPHFSEEEYRRFKDRQFARYRAMVAAGRGLWYGAFLNGVLVADLGIFYSQNLGRYQNVTTHPDYRRRGLCGTLVYEAGRHAQANFPIETLVMIADPEYHAARIYESVGFSPIERTQSLYRREKR